MEFGFEQASPDPPMDCKFSPVEHSERQKIRACGGLLISSEARWLAFPSFREQFQANCDQHGHLNSKKNASPWHTDAATLHLRR